MWLFNIRAPGIFRLPSLGKVHVVLMPAYGESEQTAYFPRCPSFFIDNCLPSRMYVIRRSCFPSCFCQRLSSDMMKLQGFITTVRSLFGGRRPTFGFVALPFFGVLLFSSPAI